MPPPTLRDRIQRNASTTYNLTKFQPHLKYCTLNLNSKTSIEYVCYTYEVCCLQGCCAGYSMRNVQSWQFWSPVVFFVVLVYFLSQFCMGAEKRRNNQHHQIVHQHNRRRCFAQNLAPTSHQPVQNEIENVNVDQFLEQLIQEYRIRYPDIECPVDSSVCSLNVPKPNGLPCYDEALFMPKPQKPSTNSRANGNDGQNQSEEVQNEESLPTYENATSR
ncbi:uncharacterized protein LOC123320573 [Coccinella septempunctata]|uniref:uncharacterized protein LOC123320573 n=1 Tax=Coccinella septempunctata TaxID=41139 RepID=UPI001D06DD9D|nr:uncharacterized protein LOC123320573 [Coccinella septempunctata]